MARYLGWLALACDGTVRVGRQQGGAVDYSLDGRQPTSLSLTQRGASWTCDVWLLRAG